MKNSILKMLEIVAVGLSDLNDEVVFVGGAIAMLYADVNSGIEIRPTEDIDCVIEVLNLSSYSKLEEKLRKLGFKNVVAADAPICRWDYKGVLVDIMPTSSDILGFSNNWSAKGLKSKEVYKLSEDVNIFILSLPFYLASKFEALKSRGAEDLRLSSDFEDILFVLDNAPSVLRKINATSDDVKKYLGTQFKELLSIDSLRESIVAHLSEEDGARIELMESLVKSISEFA